MADGVWAIVVAAGEGHRFGSAKQFEPLGDRDVIDWAVLGAARRCQGVVVVLPQSQAAGDGAWSPPSMPGRCVGAVLVTAGGVLRSDSVRRGLSLVPAAAEIVLVHDGARPLAADAVFVRVIEAVRDGADAAVPVIDLTDTIRRRDGGAADRRELVAVQTPQAFRATALRAAHAGGADATDDATLVEAAGGTVAMVAGDSRNLKITEPHDLAVAEVLLLAGHRLAAAGGDRG